MKYRQFSTLFSFVLRIVEVLEVAGVAPPPGGLVVLPGLVGGDDRTVPPAVLSRAQSQCPPVKYKCSYKYLYVAVQLKIKVLSLRGAVC